MKSLFLISSFFAVQAVASNPMDKALELREKFSNGNPISKVIYSKLSSDHIYNCFSQRTEVPFNFNEFPPFGKAGYRKLTTREEAPLIESWGKKSITMWGVHQRSVPHVYEGRSVVLGPLEENLVDGDLVTTSEYVYRLYRDKDLISVIRESGNELIIENLKFNGYSNGPTRTNPFSSVAFPIGYIVNSYEVCN